jgi:chromosomal replication initiator protein
MSPDRQLWAGMLAHLSRAHAGLCRQWFEEIEPLGIDAGALRLRARTTIHRDYLQHKCADAFTDAAVHVSGHLLGVIFLGPDDPAPAPTAPASPAAATRPAAASVEIKPGAATPADPAIGPARTTFDLVSKPVRPATDSLIINPDYCFENFVVGPSNRLAHAAAMAVAAQPGKAYNPFFVHGGVGLGKTHLLQAISLKIKEAAPQAQIYYTSCEAFITQFMDAVQAGEMSSFRHRFRDVDLLVIDDIHFLAKRDRSQEEFFHTFNSLYQGRKQIVLSSDAPPEEIPDLEERLVSRFKWGLVTPVAAPCYETRVAILKAKAKIRGLGLPEDAACHIAAKVESNIRELEGVIVKLQVLAGLEKRPVDLAMAAAALGEGPARLDRQVSIQTIITAVTEFYNVKMTDLQSKRRQRSIALPRQVCMFLARKHTRFSLEEIGGYFGGRDHTTVMHAVKTVDERCEVDSEFARAIALLDSQVKAAGD